MKGSASTALNTLISGKGDPAQAIGNYIAYATLEMGKSEVTKQFKAKFDTYSTAEKDAIKQQDARKVVADLYEDGLKEAEKIRVDATKLMKDYDNGVKTIYEPYVEKVNKLNTDVTDYKKDYDYYVAQVEKANNYVPVYGVTGEDKESGNPGKRVLRLRQFFSDSSSVDGTAPIQRRILAHAASWCRLASMVDAPFRAPYRAMRC